MTVRVYGFVGSDAEAEMIITLSGPEARREGGGGGGRKKKVEKKGRASSCWLAARLFRPHARIAAQQEREPQFGDTVREPGTLPVPTATQLQRELQRSLLRRACERWVGELVAWPTRPSAVGQCIRLARLFALSLCAQQHQYFTGSARWAFNSRTGPIRAESEQLDRLDEARLGLASFTKPAAQSLPNHHLHLCRS